MAFVTIHAIEAVLQKTQKSNLFSYLNFGHLSAQRVALEIKWNISTIERQSFLEERRELSDNYTFYNLKYDTLEGLSFMSSTFPSPS